MKKKVKIYKLLSETYKSLLKENRATPQASGILKQSNIFNIRSWAAEADLDIDSGTKTTNGDYILVCSSPSETEQTITFKIDVVGNMFVNDKQVLNKEDFEAAVKFLIS